MGMFDNIKWLGVLPGIPPAYVTVDHLFQTKDLECTLATYEIGDVFEGYHGTLTFYTTNIVASAPEGVYTRNGEDADSVTYCATYTHGKLSGIEEVERNCRPAPRYRGFSSYKYPERGQLGKVVYVKEYVSVVAESEKQIVVQYVSGKFAIFDKSLRDVMFFGSMEEAEEVRKGREELDRQRREEYQSLLVK